MRNLYRNSLIALLMTAIAGGAVARAAESPPNSNAPMLYLKDGDYIRGNLSESATPNAIRWQAQGATQPFEFNVNSFRSAYFAGAGDSPAPTGDYCFELSDGDLLYGSLAEVTDDHLIVDSAEFGQLKIARAEVRRLALLNSLAFQYRGPNGLAEWTAEGKNQWREEAGRLISSQRGASLRKAIAIPQQAHLEFEISWTKSPRFTLAFCSSEQKDQLDEGFRLEVLSQRLVLVRELKRDADLAVVTVLESNADRVHLEAYYDFPTGEFTVQALDGKQLAKITLPKKGGNPLKCVWLINDGCEVCLEQLSVSQWNGQTPPQIDTNKPRIHKSDGTIIYGDVVGYQADAKQFVVRTDGTEARLNSSDVACVVLVPPESHDSPAVRVGLDNGSRISGELTKLEGDKLYLERRGIDRPLACQVARVRSLSSLKRAVRAAPPTNARIGRWESEGILSHGSLIAAPPGADAQSACPVWKPRFSETSSPLRNDASGRIVYRDPPKPIQETEQERLMRQRRLAPRRPVGFINAIANVFSGDVPAPQPTRPNGSGTLCLVTGDRIPCSAIEIDEDGIHFTSPVITSRVVPHSSAKALEFVPQWTAAALAEEKKLRLLTLPRMQKGNPPTHLIVSTSGDFLRGRLMSMNAITASVEARLEAKQLARERVACVIWLHNELDSKPVADSPPPASPAMLVQAVQSDGVRLTFVPRECSDSTLSGVSDVLGECQVQLNSIDQLVFGAMVRKVAAEQFYGAWKMSDAVEPQFMHEESDGADPGQAASAGSILVGKAAPDFQLDLLDGGQFKLSKQTGTVIVLDFWASWCGPCMQAMPQTDKVVEEFKDQKVKLIAVNMQEDKTAINGALERLKIKPSVAMDIDGAIAERYQVTAIPQIVVIDPESNVAEVLIGANPGFADQLRAAIQKSLAPKTAPDKP